MVGSFVKTGTGVPCPYNCVLHCHSVESMPIKRILSGLRLDLTRWCVARVVLGHAAKEIAKLGSFSRRAHRVAPQSMERSREERAAGLWPEG